VGNSYILFLVHFLYKCNLGVFEIYNNSLEGELPDELYNLPNLYTLDLGFNLITGTISSLFVQLSELKYLFLENNYMTGTLPDELYNLPDLQVLSLYSNHITGTISSQVGQLSNLNFLYLANNYMTGIIPTELGEVFPLGEFIMHLPT
jgi:Leucine-rich repeat (LRR) protein